MTSEADGNRTEESKVPGGWSQPPTRSAQGENAGASTWEPWLCLGCSDQHGVRSLLLEPSLASVLSLCQREGRCAL